LVQAGAPLVEIGDPLNLEVVADLLSADATQIEKGAAVRIDGWGGTALQVTRLDSASKRSTGRPQGLAGNPLHLRRMAHPPR
jgi:HlyD family secretion protein